MQEYLPYKSYKPLASGLLRTTLGRAGQGTLASPGTSEYRIMLRIQGEPGEGQGLFVDHFRLGDRHDSLLDTSFRLDRGETVVVGTSKLNGSDDALIVLLTALP